MTSFATAAYRTWWTRRQHIARQARAQRQARARLDAGWRRLPARFDPISPLLPPSGQQVLLRGFVEVHTGEWIGDIPQYRSIEVIRQGSWWGSIDSFVFAQDIGRPATITAWQPLPPDADRWERATPAPPVGL